MGVIHKLHPDVVDFIISRKKSEPSLGCRSLADMVRVELQVEVSKSAVNNLLKAGGLSDSVGRKKAGAQSVDSSGSGRKKSDKKSGDTFKIPPVRKYQILKSLERAREIVKPDPPHSVRAPKKSRPVSIPGSKYLSKTSGPKTPSRESPFERAGLTLRHGVLSGGQFCLGAGLIFLKAAQWSMTSKSIWPEVFMVPDSARDDFAARQEAECFLRMIGGEDAVLEDFGAHAVCKMNDYKAGSAQPFILDEKEAPSAYESETMIARTRVSVVKIVLNNGASFWVDAQMTAVQGSRGQCPFGNLPLAQAVKVVSRRWIAQRAPIILFSVPDDKEVASVFHMHDACLNQTECGFSSMAFLDNKDRVVFECSVFPQMDRKYLMGLWPRKTGAGFWFPGSNKDGAIGEQFSVTLQERHSNETKSDYHVLSKEKVVFKDYDMTVTDNKTGLVRSLRSVNVLSKNQVLFGILTNDFNSSPETLAGIYLERWPNGNRLLSKDATHRNIIDYDTIADENHIRGALKDKGGKSFRNKMFDHFTEMLLDEAVEGFFRAHSENIAIKEVIKELIKISGTIRISRQSLEVSLQPPPQIHPLRPVLQSAADKLNERDILDWEGRNVRVYIE